MKVVYVAHGHSILALILIELNYHTLLNIQSYEFTHAHNRIALYYSIKYTPY